MEENIEMESLSPKIEIKGMNPPDDLLKKLKTCQNRIFQFNSQFKKRAESSNYPYFHLLFWLKLKQKNKKQSSIFKKTLKFILAWILSPLALLLMIIYLFTNIVAAAIALTMSLTYWFIFDENRRVAFLSPDKAEKIIAKKMDVNKHSFNFDKAALWIIPTIGVFGVIFKQPILSNIFLYFTFLYVYPLGLILIPVTDRLEKRRLKQLEEEAPTEIDQFLDNTIDDMNSNLSRLESILKQLKSKNINVKTRFIK